MAHPHHPNQPQQRQQQQPAQPLEIVKIDTSSHATALIPVSVDGAMSLARWLSNSNLIPPALRGKEADVFMVIACGMELGLPPIAALRGVYIVNGRPALESKTKAAICLARGAAEYFKRIEYTPEATTWETRRVGHVEPVRMRFTRKEAEQAGLTRKDGPWQNYPQRMISWRALGWLCDDVYPDVVLGVATAEDFDTGEMTYSPIGGGVELGVPPPPPSATQVIGGPPATAKDANAKPPPPQDIQPDEIAELEKKLKTFQTPLELNAWAKEHISGRTMSDATRARLLRVYEEQIDLMEVAKANEPKE